MKCGLLLTVTVMATVTATAAQLLDTLFPGARLAARQLTDVLVVNNPVVSLGAHVAAQTIAGTADLLTRVPIAAARRLDLANPYIPMFSSASNTNLAGLSQSIISQYKAGLGNQDASLGIERLVAKYGQRMERHVVQTADGYLLTVFRIPGAGPAVFLMHGLMGSADDWVVAGAASGLAYLLARDRYDVWLGNARGNKHSRHHLHLDPLDAAFWDFSWHEIGFYDLPAMIDYVLEQTNSSKLKYVGHSQGTTSFFVMASERPEYNEKIDVMIALSPVAFMENLKSPMVRILAPGSGVLHVISKHIGLYEFLPDDIFMQTLKLLMCGIGTMSELLCNNIVFLMAGFDFPQLNVTNLPVVFGHMPSGCAIKQFVHYGQEVLSGRFCKFDYGTKDNLVRYGREKPPDYQVHRITAPVALFFSDDDWLAHPTDVDKLYTRLGNVVDLYKVPYKDFNHLDFIIAKDFKTLIYRRLWKVLEYYSR